MNKLFRRWGFTPGERRAALFIIAALLLGWAYRYYQQHSLPNFTVTSAGDSIAVEAIRSAYFASVEEASGSLDHPSSGSNTGQESHAWAEVDRRIDINSASREQLECLPGIGPVLAERIIARREKVNGFSSLDDLLAVRGIGQERLDRIRPLVRCEPVGNKEDKL